MNPRRRRLNLEEELLRELCEQTELISYEPINQVPGFPPEEYLIHYHVKSIVGIDDDKSPIYGDKHTLKIVCPSTFPLIDIPSLTMMTNAWHPNISFGGQSNGHVCTNKEEFDNTATIDQFVIFVGKMLQWKKYHATWVHPYPQDSTVAEWVKEFAEPNGIVDKKKGIVIDKRPLLEPSKEWLESRVQKRKIIVEIKRKTIIEPKKSTPKIEVIINKK
jgi:ubiquitin-protein ligase